MTCCRMVSNKTIIEGPDKNNDGNNAAPRIHALPQIYWTVENNAIGEVPSSCN